MRMKDSTRKKLERKLDRLCRDAIVYDGSAVNEASGYSFWEVVQDCVDKGEDVLLTVLQCSTLNKNSFR